MCGRRVFTKFLVVLFLIVLAHSAVPAWADEDPSLQQAEIRIGIIGLDTSHAIHFTKLFNEDDQDQLPEIAGCRVVAAYPRGSADIESSVSRIPQYTTQVQEMDVEIVDSIEELLKKVDVVLLETNDGRPHLEQALPVLSAGKPLFIDKPMAASLVDVITIFDAAEHYGTPVFSSSALRYGKGTQEVRGGSIGPVLGCDTHGPCTLEQTHPDLFWYGVHGVEALFTVMGTGCQSVSRTHTADAEMVVGVWDKERIGTYRGMRAGTKAFGGMAFGTSGDQAVGSYNGYQPLVVEIARFFRGADPPVSQAETIEIFAFMEAADLSKERDGEVIPLAPFIEKARNKAQQKQNW